MKVILVFVSTLNGKITRGDDPEVRHWSSKSDQEHYSRVWRNSSLIVMGSNTYNLNIITPSTDRLIVVMTRNPELYREKQVAGQLEFSNTDPPGLVSEFSRKDYDLMTVVGGPQLATSFLKANLADELLLTIEPRIFGQGHNLVTDDDLDVRLRLMESTRANDQGTLINRYSIIK